MIKAIRNALKVKDIRERILFTLLCLAVVRLGSQLPIPGIDRSRISEFLNQITQLSFLNICT